MIDPTLLVSLAAFDDAVLATLANAGLVRRAHRDVETGKVSFVEAEDGTALIEVDGQRVTIDTRGPKAAACACKSVAICRHRIAAVIFLRTFAKRPFEQDIEQEELGDPSEIVNSLDLNKVKKWAGKASWRAALEIAGTAVLVEAAANTVTVSFMDLEDGVRILRGHDFDQIASKAPKARLKAYHAAAILAARSHFGAAPPEVQENEEADKELPVEIDPAFVAQISTGLAEVAALGLNLAPLPLEESLFKLSVSSRADSLPRLASLLRAIAAQLRLRRQRAMDFDPDQLLELAATAYALTGSLVSGDAERRTQLVGKVRRDFVPAEPLDLVGCGGERWHTINGARGVTAWFVEPDTGQWLSTSLARGPGQDPAFIPADAWRHQALWQADSLSVLAHARIKLAGSNRSPDGRLSAPAAAKATVISKAVRVDPSWPQIVQNWSELRQRWLDQSGLGLDSVETPAVCLIAPSAISAPWFDDLAQQLVWPVRDNQGQWLALKLDADDSASLAIEALEANVRSGWEGVVLARLLRRGDLLEVRPITLFGRGDPVDITLWHPPWHKKLGGSGMRDWLTRLRGDKNRHFVRQPRGRTELALAEAWRHLMDRAEIGPALAKMLDADLESHAVRLESYGLPKLAALLRQSHDRHGFLKVAFALLIARQQRCAVELLQ